MRGQWYFPDTLRANTNIHRSTLALPLTGTASALPSRQLLRELPASIATKKAQCPNHNHNSCYNNCPSDTRAAPAQQEVGVFCQNASLYGTKAQASKTAAAAGQSAASTPASNNAASTGATKPTGSATESAATKPTGSSAAAAINANGAVLAGIAGLVAAML